MSLCHMYHHGSPLEVDIIASVANELAIKPVISIMVGRLSGKDVVTVLVSEPIRDKNVFLNKSVFVNHFVIITVKTVVVD